MSIYNRLYRLFSKYNQPRALEDFTTEILVGILAKDPILLAAFVKEVLGIEEESKRWTITPQKYYKTFYKYRRSFVDVVIESSTVLCFLENKIWSSENQEAKEDEAYTQLEKYADLALKETAKTKKKAYLRFCTLFEEEKNFENIDFSQFKWSSIADFLKPCQDKNPEIASFLEFLNEQNILPAKFRTEELKWMEKMESFIPKMILMLEETRKAFGFRQHQLSNFHDYNRHKRMVYMKRNPIAGGVSDYTFGFNFRGAPTISVGYWMHREHSLYPKFEQLLLNKYPNQNYYIEERKEYYFKCTQLLESMPYQDAEELKKAMEKWFDKHLKEVEAIIKTLKTK